VTSTAAGRAARGDGSARGVGGNSGCGLPFSAVQTSWWRPLALSVATGGLVSAISIGAPRELLAQDLIEALGQVRCAVEQGR